MCVCARRQPSPTAASPGSPWSPVRVPLCSAASSTCLPPNIVHTALAAALAIPPAAVPACLIAFANKTRGLESQGVSTLSALESKLARRQYLVNTKLSELHIN